MNWDFWFDWANHICWNFMFAHLNWFKIQRFDRRSLICWGDITYSSVKQNFQSSLDFRMVLDVWSAWNIFSKECFKIDSNIRKFAWRIMLKINRITYRRWLGRLRSRYQSKHFHRYKGFRNHSLFPWHFSRSIF